MEHLPHDVLSYLFSFMSFPSLFRLSATCKRLHQLANQYEAWITTRKRISIIFLRHWISPNETLWVYEIVDKHNDLLLLENFLKDNSDLQFKLRLLIAYEFFSVIGREDILTLLAKYGKPIEWDL